jgi:hypothetical protein
LLFGSLADAPPSAAIEQGEDEEKQRDHETGGQNANVDGAWCEVFV